MWFDYREKLYYKYIVKEENRRKISMALIRLISCLTLFVFILENIDEIEIMYLIFTQDIKVRVVTFF